jgi:uncharacterized protein YjcR
MIDKKRRGGQPGNKNAVGNCGGAPIGNTNALGYGAPKGNRNAVKHGLYGHTGIYSRRAFDYEVLTPEGKELFHEMLKDTGNIASAENLFRVHNFESNIPLNYKNPYAALMKSTHILMAEYAKYKVRKYKQTTRRVP